MGVDNITSMAQDSIAVRTGIRVDHNGTHAPRGLWGGDQQYQVKVRCGIPDAVLSPRAATAKGLSGLFLFRAAVKAHAVVGSQVARPPEKTEPLAALYSRGDQNRVSGQNGVGVGLPRMATDADSSPAVDQGFKGKIAGVSQRLSMTKTCPEKAK